jgi:hypothetical protein
MERFKTYCKRGHLLNGRNILVSEKGVRTCAVCKKARDWMRYNRTRKPWVENVYWKPALTRVLETIDKDPVSDCWLWLGLVTHLGYGVFKVNGKRRVVHHWLYEHVNGVLDEGLELDHLCRTRRCCNPQHLEPVTHRENVRRGSVGKYLRIKIYCRHGHLYEGNNIYVCPKGHRQCRECRRLANIKSQANRRNPKS